MCLCVCVYVCVLCTTMLVYTYLCVCVCVAAKEATTVALTGFVCHLLSALIVVVVALATVVH